jgi:hypothetical protein
VHVGASTQATAARLRKIYVASRAHALGSFAQAPNISVSLTRHADRGSGHATNISPPHASVKGTASRASRNVTYSADRYVCLTSLDHQVMPSRKPDWAGHVRHMDWSRPSRRRNFKFLTTHVEPVVG